MKFIALILLTSCTTSKTFVVIGHEIYGQDTINVVRRIKAECDKSVVYPIGTIICKGKLKLL
jgi:hypothetical protein